MKCDECDRGFPQNLLGEFVSGKKTIENCCPLCALKLRNEAHELPENEGFQGPKAKEMYEKALKHLGLPNNTLTGATREKGQNMVGITPEKWTDEQRNSWLKWLAGRPKPVMDLAMSHPPWKCYKSTDNPGHYAIASYTEDKDGTATLSLNHASDSFLPGVQVFGVDPKKVVVCGCGTALYPTDEQFEKTKTKMNFLASLVQEEEAV